jgi:hypothetical protein
MPGRASYAWAMLAVTTALGCGTEVKIPADALIGCTTVADCPSGRLCHQGLCVRPEGIDTTPPDLAAAPAVSPAVGRVGLTFTVDLTPTEPLLESPEVVLSLVPPVTAPCVASGSGYRCTYTATGSENGGQGGVVPFDVRLRDRSRNEALKKLAGALNLDFTAPAAASASVEPGNARFGAAIQVFVTASEPLAGDPVLVTSRELDFGRGTRFPMARQGVTLNWTFAHLVTGGPQGEVSFTVEMTDVAGNAATAVAVGASNVDSIPPVVGAVAVSPARVNGNGTVAATFNVDEAVLAPVVTVGGRTMTCGGRQATSPNYTCTRPMQGDEIAVGEEQAQSVVVDVEDAAGNRDTAGGGVVFDFKAPAVATAAIAYLPEASNPLQAVTRARPNTEIRVSLTADEALDPGSPPVLSMAGVPVFTLVPATLGPTGAVFTASAPSLPDGDYSLTVTWSDAAGNSVSLVLAEPLVRIKTSRPTLAVDQAAVSFLRAPWGVADIGWTITSPDVPSGRPFAALAPADALSPTYRLPASAFSAAGGISILRVWKDATQGSLLVSRIQPATDGSWPRALVPGGEDLPTVWVSAVDDAGNESELVRLANAEWVATPGQPAGGPSPHDVHAWHYAAGSLVPDPAVTEPRPPGPPGLALLQQAHTALRQRFAATASRPSRRTGFGVAFDPARGRVVLYGGRAASGEPLADTWEWDGTSWSEATPASGFGPGPVLRPLVAYDGARGRVVLEDGRAQVWEWDGAAWSRRWMTGACADYHGFMAYDSVRERIVVVPFFLGGSTTCEWDGGAWSTSSFGVDPPTMRTDAAMAYDARRGVMVFYGGSSYTSDPSPVQVVSDELWERDGTSWHLVAQSGAVPGGRHGHALAFDATSGRVLLFGGADGSGSLHADVRAWDGTRWTEVAPAGGGPAARRLAGAAYDPGRERLVVHGGVGVSEVILDDTWELGPGGWADASVDRPSPPARRDHAMAYDPLRGVVVLYGGADTVSLHADVWEYDGQRWREVTPAAGPPAPGPRLRHAMAFHSASGKLLVYGGWSFSAGGRDVSDLWEWTGTAWVDRTPASSPPARESAGLSDDTSRGVLVLTGGQYFDSVFGERPDHWELSAPGGVFTWTQRAASLPVGLPRSNHAQFFDGTRTLVVGGFRLLEGTLSDVWAYDGSSWSLLVPDTPGHSGPPGTREGGAWDPVRRRGLLLGDPLQSWDPYRLEWTGDGFEVVRPTSTERWPLDQRAYTSVAFDARRGRAVIFGGADANDTDRVLGDTWELDADVLAGAGGPLQRRAPAVQFTVRYGGAGFAESQVAGLRVRARAGGDFAPTGSGAMLLGWQRGGLDNPGGRWLELAAGPGGIPLGASPEGLVAWTADGGQLPRLFRTRDKALAFQVRPAGAPPADAADASVQVEYLEVRVRYAVP